MTNKDPDVIPIDCNIPSEVLMMMKDYISITNHLISYGIHHKIGLEKHYYPLVTTDTSGKPKPIPPFREIRDNNREWFHTHYKGKYLVHYLDSAASFAMQMIKSWRTFGGDITSIPHVRKPIAQLFSDLYKINKLEPDGTLQIEILLAPHKSVIINTKVNHRNWSEYSQNRNRIMVIVPSGLRLCFTDETPLSKSKESVAYDFNFDRVVMARSDGEIQEVDLSQILKIQKNHKRKRESVQKTMSHNPQKAQRLLQKNSGREHNRVNDLLHKKIHGKNNEILSFVQDHHLGIEDLHNTTKDILKDDHGKKFNAKMSNWIHGQFEQIISHHHPDSSLYYTRGTSHFCPFCNEKLTHPIWKQSVCPIHGLFDRDRLESVSGLVRTNTKHKKGQPWHTVSITFPKSIEAKLLQNSKILQSSNINSMIRDLSLDFNLSLKSVHPECAILYPEAQSDIGNSFNGNAMLENRNDVDIQKNIGLINPIESGNDANFEVDKHTFCLSM